MEISYVNQKEITFGVVSGQQLDECLHTSLDAGLSVVLGLYEQILHLHHEHCEAVVRVGLRVRRPL